MVRAERVEQCSAATTKYAILVRKPRLIYDFYDGLLVVYGFLECMEAIK